ncbi:MAG: GNAT family N-acetyltransferase [Jiangellaceae bacterium]
MRIRPVRADDVGEVAAVTRAARSDVEHLLRQDAPGCWVADADGEVAGAALSTRRDLLWCLSALAVGAAAEAVAPTLLDATLSHSRGCLGGVAVLPDDPATARFVRQAGFVLHPTMRLTGRIDRSARPLIDGVREATDADRALVDSVDRQVRSAARGPDHGRLQAGGGLLVCELTTGSGYAFHRDGSPVALAATTREVARRLLWSVLTRSPAGSRVAVGGLTAEQDWAVDVGLAAGLGVQVGGFLALRHMRPPMPYLPSAWLG